MKVFIIGISGGTGRRIASVLIEQGHNVSGLSRDPRKVAPLEQIGVQAVEGDIQSLAISKLAQFIGEADAIIFTAGTGANDDESIVDLVDYAGVTKTIAAMKLAGRSRLLLISVFPEAAREQCPGESFDRYIAAKKKADVAVSRSGLDWIILRPSSLTEQPGTGRVDLGLASVHTTISRDDVATAAVTLLTERRITRKILEVTRGDQAISDAVSNLLSL